MYLTCEEKWNVLPNPRIARGRCVTILSTIYSQWSPRQFATHSPNIGIPPLSPRTVRPQQSISPPARVYFNLSTISSPIKRNTFHCYHLVRPSNLFHIAAVIMFLRNKESGCEKRNSCTVYVLLSQTVNCFMSQLFLVRGLHQLPNTNQLNSMSFECRSEWEIHLIKAKRCIVFDDAKILSSSDVSKVPEI